MNPELDFVAVDDGELFLNGKWYRVESIFTDQEHRVISFVMHLADGTSSPVALLWEGVSTKVVVDWAKSITGGAGIGVAVGTLVPLIGHAIGAVGGAMLGLFLQTSTSKSNGYYVVSTSERVHDQLLFTNNIEQYRNQPVVAEIAEPSDVREALDEPSDKNG